MPATFTWTGAVSELWSNPANWEENRAPEAGPGADIDRNDVLFFPQDATRYTSVNDITSGPVHAAEIEIDAPYDISGGTLRLDSGVAPGHISVGIIPIQARWNVNTELAGGTSIFVSGTIDGPTRLLIGGVLSGAGSILKEGDGVLILDAHNTFSGTTLIREGTLEVREADALGATAAETIVDTGGRLQFGPGSAAGTESLAVTGGQLQAETDASWAGPVTIIFDPSGSPSPAIVRVNGATSDLTLTGPVSGNASLAKEGMGTLVFAGNAANSYSGATQVREGRLDLNKSAGVNAILGSVFIGFELVGAGAIFSKNGGEVRLLGDNQIFNTATVSVGRGGLLNVNGHSDTVGELKLQGGRVTTGVGTLTLNGNVITTFVDARDTVPTTAALVEGNLALGSVTRFFDVADGPFTTDVTVAAAISGTGGLTKIGAGRLLLSGNNSYTGATQVNAGQLVVDGNQPSSSVQVNAGGMLSGSGTVGPLTVRADGTVRPGDSLTVTGNATFGGFKSAFQPFVGSVVNGLGATGTLNLNNAKLSILDVNIPGALPPLGVPLPVASAASVIGLFNALPQGAIAVSLSGLPYRVTYTPNIVFVTRLGGPAFQDRAITPVIDEGNVATLTGRITTTEPRDNFFLEVNWGDGTRTEIHKVKPGAPRDLALKHRYLDDGTYTVELLWRDQRGAFNTGTLEITVRNVAPMVFAGPDLTLKSGGSLTRHLVARDASQLDLLTAAVDYGDGTGSQLLRLKKHGQFKLHHRYSQPGDYRVTVTVQDDDGAVTTDSFRVRLLGR